MAFTTWNPSDKHADITLSNGDLTATSASNLSRGIRSVLGVSSGKYYWEITPGILDPSWSGIGIGNSSANLASRVGGDANGYGYVPDGTKRYNGSAVAYGGSFVNGDIIGVALDMTAGKIWWAKNGVWQASGDPAAGTNEAYSGISGTFYAMVSMDGAGHSFTANFGASAFSYSVPSGFSGLGSQYDINVINPSMTAQGYTGIQAVCSLPMIQTEGYTGIDARNVINPSMTIEGFTGIYSAPSIPMIRANATLSDNMIHVESSLIIPSMTAEVTQADQIWGNVTIPAMTAEITERETVLGNVSIPMTTVELTSGIHADLEVTIPIMTIEGTFSNQCEVTLPMMTVEVEGIVGRVINSDIRLPMVTVEMTGKTEHLIDCDVLVPTMRVVANLMTGKIITGATTLPMMEAALTSYEDITGDIDAFVPMVEAYMVATAERAECVVLRYAEPVL